MTTVLERIAQVTAAIDDVKHTVWCHPSQLATFRAALTDMPHVTVQSSSMITQPDTVWVMKDSLYSMRPH